MTPSSPRFIRTNDLHVDNADAARPPIHGLEEQLGFILFAYPRGGLE